MASLRENEIPIYEKLTKSCGFPKATHSDSDERNSNALRELVNASEALPAFASAVSADIDYKSLVRQMTEPPACEILADMPDDELAVMLKIADDQVNARNGNDVRKLRGCVENLETVEDWAMANYAMSEILAIIDSYDRLAAAWEPFRLAIRAEQKRRAEIIDKQQRRKRYIEENYLEIIEGLLTGDGRDEILRNVENPPISVR